MSKKFTGITSAGSAIPVYDKDAHSALEQKLDTSAFSSVSGDFLTEVPESAVSGFATHEEVESATSGKADTSGVVEYTNKPSVNAIFAGGNSLANVAAIFGEPDSNFHIVTSSVLQVPNVITANTGGLTANGLSANVDSAWGGFSANGITAGPIANLAIQGQGESLEASYGAGFTFSSVNTAFGTAKLTTAAGNSVVQVYSPKFEARNVSGAGFSIEASGAKGYDHAGNVVWDTSVVPPANNLIGYNDTKASSGGLNSNIILTVYGKSNTNPLTSAPYTILDSYGLTASYGPSANAPSIQIKPDEITIQTLTRNGARAKFGLQAGGVQYDYSGLNWSLTGSVQKREIECDSATSAITAIAGSAIGGGGEVPEGVMVESAVGYNAVNEISGYNGSAIAQYGAEKQWLVHDDTIVSISNSAQYALGVNLSAVAQLLGVDETVLFDTTAVNGTGVCNLSESLKNFKRIKVLATRGYNGTSPGGFAGPWSEWETDGISADGKDFHSIAPFMFEGVNWKNSMYSADNTYTTLTWYQGQQTNIITHVASTANSYTGCVGIKTVIGIGRKQ